MTDRDYFQSIARLRRDTPLWRDVIAHYLFDGPFRRRGSA
jgi:hypothetical protein